MWRPQNSEICPKVSEEFSTSQEAVAGGIRGWATGMSPYLQTKWAAPSRSGRRGGRCKPAPAPEQGHSGLHRDKARLALHTPNPLGDVRESVQPEVGLARDVGIGEQADVGEAHLSADEPVAVLKMVVHQLQRRIPRRALRVQLQALRLAQIRFAKPP